MAILGELDRAGLIHRDTKTVHAPTMGDALDNWDVMRTNNPDVHDFYRAAPGGVRTTQAFSQSNKYTTLDMDRAGGVIRDKKMPFLRMVVLLFCSVTSQKTAAS